MLYTITENGAKRDFSSYCYVRTYRLRDTTRGRPILNKMLGLDLPVDGPLHLEEIYLTPIRQARRGGYGHASGLVPICKAEKTRCDKKSSEMQSPGQKKDLEAC